MPCPQCPLNALRSGPAPALGAALCCLVLLWPCSCPCPCLGSQYASESPSVNKEKHLSPPKISPPVRQKYAKPAKVRQSLPESARSTPESARVRQSPPESASPPEYAKVSKSPPESARSPPEHLAYLTALLQGNKKRSKKLSKNVVNQI